MKEVVKMKVTKRIEEHIVNTLRNKGQAKIDALWEPSRKERKAIREELEAVLAEANAKAEAILEKYPQYTIQTRYSNPNSIAFITNFSELYFKPGYDRELSEETDRIRTKAKEAANDIIIELELGGDKETLVRLLNEVTF
jgi:hypothetical protein